MQGSVPNEEIERYAVTLSHICVCFDPFFFSIEINILERLQMKSSPGVCQSQKNKNGMYVFRKNYVLIYKFRVASFEVISYVSFPLRWKKKTW